jgi:hypothetical protein
VRSRAPLAGMSTPPVTAHGAVAAAGWYADPANPRAKRYWNGAAWTRHIAAETAPTAPHGSSVPTGLVVAGYILAIVTPLIGRILRI